MTLLVPATRPSEAWLTVRAAALSAAAAASLLLSTAAAGLGLGDIEQQSALGEPFRATVRVIADADEAARGELSPECFRLVAPESERSADLPVLVFGRATLAHAADGPQIMVASDTVASDPALSFALEAGCRLRVRREYIALLDPPIVRESVAASPPSPATLAAANSAPPSRQVRVSPAETKSAVPPRGRRPPYTATTTIATGEVRASSIGAPRKWNGTRLRGKTRAEAPPQLRVSHSANARGDPAVRKQTDAEIRQEVEAETIVLQRRIAELSVTLARLDEELRAARAARDDEKRRASVTASQPGAIGSWFVPALLVAAVLALIAMSVRALRTPTLRSIGMSPLVASTLGPALSEASEAALRHGPARVPPAPLPNDLDDSLQPMAEPSGRDDEASFDDDLIHYAEQRKAYSVLEREQPKVVAAVMRDWGRPKVIAYLRDILVSPRKPRGVFSREAVSDLMFLQALAMERAGYGTRDHPWRIDLPVRRRA